MVDLLGVCNGDLPPVMGSYIGIYFEIIRTILVLGLRDMI